ncbi:hydA cytochrome c3 hydrogenase alpha chain [Legionella cherrii]|uniref:HydA cytochrome c3 hydrogenase alpha chain n=1 Tax=Legionella cherrii TaxID=28084 RepID=A0ABY6TAL0_9GAMM|nr:nickel-dependent hydrogenase large subunit [Legionella cherrii]VEB38877.1 hydA cytochrome c3 hydrogenase alpha chain [Legionella cherrii]
MFLFWRRVEGEGALELHIRNSKISKLQLKIYEPPRLFEKFLEGRSYAEVLDLVARICGICPVAYQMSATQAIEQCFGLQPSLGYGRCAASFTAVNGWKAIACTFIF